MSVQPDISLERYSFGFDDVDDLTEFVTSVSWSHGTSQPWGSIKASLAIPRRQWASRMPYLGDWLVVRDNPTGKALQWAYVTDRSTGITSSTQGHITTTQTSISAISWLDFLGHISLYTSPLIGKQHGTIINSNDWLRGPWSAIGEIMSERFSDEGYTDILWFGKKRKLPGYALARVLAELPLPLIPFGLSEPKPKQVETEQVQNAVRVVYNDATAISYAPLRQLEAVPGYRADASVAQLAAPLRDVSVLNILQHTFMVDPNLVEFFPSLEDPGTVEVSGDVRDSAIQRAAAEKYDVAGKQYLQSLVASGTTAHFGETLDQAEEFKKTKLGPHLKEGLRKAAQEGGQRFASRTGAELKQNPVLMYRMRPWRVMSVADMLTARPAAEKKRAQDEDAGFDRLVDGHLETFKYDRTTFNSKTWDERLAVTIPADIINGISFDATDSAHINAVGISLPNAPEIPVDLMAELGLPLLRRDSISMRGVRMFRPLWPFMPPSDGTKPDEPMMAFLRTMAMISAQIMLLNDRFETGAIQCSYMPVVRHGEPISVELPFGVPGTSKSRASVGLSARMLAYAEGVTHTVEVGAQGAVTGKTTIAYSRGLLNEASRAVPYRFTGVGGLRGK